MHTQCMNSVYTDQYTANSISQGICIVARRNANVSRARIRDLSDRRHIQTAECNLNIASSSSSSLILETRVGHQSFSFVIRCVFAFLKIRSNFCGTSCIERWPCEIANGSSADSAIDHLVLGHCASSTSGQQVTSIYLYYAIDRTHFPIQSNWCGALCVRILREHTENRLISYIGVLAN